MALADNKRIARNTMFLYFRMLITMGVTLNATQRFLNFETGTGDEDKVNQIFNQSLLLNTLVGVLVAVVGAVFGDWLVTDFLEFLI